MKGIGGREQGVEATAALPFPYSRLPTPCYLLRSQSGIAVGPGLRPAMLVTTTNDLTGYRIVRHLGVVRGVTVRSRNVIAGFGAMLQTLKGGNITIYTRLAEQARAEAYELLVRHAQEVGANAILAMRYDANEINAGVTEVLAYGTAVVVEKVS